jgi:hypothetical protein
MSYAIRLASGNSYKGLYFPYLALALLKKLQFTLEESEIF